MIGGRGRTAGWWLAAACALLPAGAEAGETTELAGLLPPETLVYLQPPARRGVDPEYENSVVNRIAQLPEMAAFRADLDRSRDELVRRIADEAKLSADVLRPLVDGGLAGALLDLAPAAEGGVEPVWVAGLALDAAPSEDALFNALMAYFNQPKYVQLARERGVPAQNICWAEEWTEGAGHSVLMVLGTSPLRIVLLGDLLLIYRGPDKEPLAQILRRYDQPVGRDSLAHLPRFQAARTGSEARPDARFVYLNMERALELAGAALPPTAAQALEVLGLASVDAVGFSGIWTDEGLRQTVYLHAPGTRTGLLAALRAQPGAERYAAALAPADAAWTLAARLDWVMFYEEFPRLLDAARTLFGYQGGAGFTRWAQGFTILDVPARDIVATLGDDLVMIDGPDGCVPLFYNVNLADFARAVQRMEQAAGAAFRALPAAGQGGVPLEVRYLNEAGDVVLPAAPSFCIYGRQKDPAYGAVLVATHPQAILGALARMSQPRLAQAPDFQRVAAGAGKDYGLFFYSPSRESYRRVYNALLPVLSAWRSLPLLAANPALLPPGSTVTPHLFGSSFGLKIADDGLTLTAFSPIGLGGIGCALLDNLILSNSTLLGMAGRRAAEAMEDLPAPGHIPAPVPPANHPAGGPPRIGDFP